MAVIAFRDCVNQTPGEEDLVVRAFMPEVMPYLVHCLQEDSPDAEQLLDAFNVCLYNYPRTLGRPAGVDLPDQDCECAPVASSATATTGVLLFKCVY